MKRISATTAARHLSDILDEVENRCGEFVIERHGREVAMITPNGPRRLTWGEVLNEATDWPRPDARFAQDLAAVRGDQGELAEDAWGSS